MYTKQITGLHLAIPKTDDELSFIAKLYAQQNPIGMIPVDIQKSIIGFRNALHIDAYLRLIKKGNVIHGFIGGMLGTTGHTSEKTVQQLYYYCNLESLEALRALLLAHEGLIKYAEGLKAKNVLSTCSQFYNNDNLAKILKTQGWDTFGFVALWKTSHHEYPSSNPRNR